MNEKRFTAIVVFVLLAILPSTHLLADSGGPDGGGYQWCDDYPFEWIDTSAGTPVSLSDDSVTSALPIGFEFSFYGVSYTEFFIGSNGLITFGTGHSGYNNSCPPVSGTPNEAVLGYWDDLNPSYGGHIRYITLGDAPVRTLVVEYNTPHYGNSSSYINFQIVLYEGTNSILLQYLDPSSEAGSSGTSGIKSGDENGIGYVCNEAILTADLAVLFFNSYGLSCAIGDDGYVALSWDDVVPVNEGYAVYRDTEEEGEYDEIGDTDPGVTEYSDETVAECTTYFYKVAAVTTAGTLGMGQAVSETSMPFAPDNLETVSETSVSVRLTWRDNSACEDGYSIERKTGDDGEFVEMAIVAMDVTSYVDEDLTPGLNYFYRVRAIKGDKYSPYSEVSDQTVMLEAPTALAGEVQSSTEADLSWSDNCTGEDGFSIERSDDQGSTFNEVANVGQDVSTYRDTALTPGETYVYRVRAVGNNVFSEYSNDATVEMTDSSEQPSDDDDDDSPADDDDDDDDDDDSCGC